MQRSIRIPTIVFLIFLSVVMGCHQGRAKPPGFPALQSCRLTFTQEGQPVVSASVTLYSTDPEFKWSVGGFTDGKGEVVLKTNGFFEGIPIGEYKVTLQKMVREGPPLPDESQLPEDEAARAKISREIERQTSYFSVIAPEYEKPDSTSLLFEAKKGKNVQTFELGKPVKNKVIIYN